MKNFLIKQYRKDALFKINHNYLREQFLSNKKNIIKSILKVVKNTDYTLGTSVNVFENKIKSLLKAKYVVSVGSGTDALMLSLKALNVKEGDEVITTPYTFYATIGAIVSAGAKPVFVDVKDDYNIDEKLIEKKITNKTKAILPVHWSGRICNMKKILQIAKKNKVSVVEDSCHAILAEKFGKIAGNFGDFGCFSMHPLKNLNVWGDGGFVLVKKKKDFEKLMLLRNHGLVGRNKNLIFAYNSRLDSIQAAVANEMLKKIKYITKKRILNASILDKYLSAINDVKIIQRDESSKEVFHLYEFRVKKKIKRNPLVSFLRKKKIDAKIHYPVPMHLQPAAKKYGYKKGDFPNAELIANTTISLPVHEFISIKQLKFMATTINYFFSEY
jgi:dTDP-4-amino-4,6-dideoxygalactose transaminase